MNNKPNGERFDEPVNWRWHQYKTPNGKSVRYGSAFPKDSIPDAVVIILPGRTEFAEKYHEVSRDLLARNYGVWILEFVGQGRSDRYFKDREKRHIVDFGYETETLYKLIKDYAKPAAVHPEVGRIPLILLGVSAGANVGIRFMQKYPQYFMAAALVAPMIKIAKPSWAGNCLRLLMCNVLRPFNKSYVPGKQDWTCNGERKKFGESIFSSDKERDAMHYNSMAEDEELRVGDPTIKWYHEAVKSCGVVNKDKFLEQIKIPCLVATAGKDCIVDSGAAQDLARRLPNASILDLEQSQHEILMERDDIRDRFFESFDNLIRKNVLSNEDRFEKF